MTDIRGLLMDENAVSPVIGVVLMVAVTVILSAAVGAFVLDIGNAVTEEQPQSVIDLQYTQNNGSADTLTLSHGGGDRLAPGEVTVTIDGTPAWHDGSTQNSYKLVSSDWDDDVTSGEELVLKEDGSAGASINPDMPVQVVWQKGQRSSVLASETL